MSKYDKREFRVGDYWLDKRNGSPAFYRCWLDGRQVRRASLGTADFEVAKRRLEEWYVEHRQVDNEKPADASLADVLRRYWEEHGKLVASADSNKDCLKRWLEFWGDSRVSDLQDIKRQEAFHAWMKGKGYAPTSMMRVINTGKAAINRAYKRQELTVAPFILTVSVGTTAPNARPLSVDELQALYENAVPHIRSYIAWAIGTAARPEAILELHARQIDWEEELVNLNPQGRKQQPRKFRPIVRLPEALGTRFEGWAVAYHGQRVESVKKGLWRASDRAGIERCSSYSFRHTAARWMRRKGVPPWEVAAQLGHSMGKQYAVSERYAAYSPDYLASAVTALNELVCLTIACQFLVPQEGLEPPTPSLRMRCSTS